MGTRGIEVPRLDCDCALCRVKPADEVGSHLAPNFVIHRAFSFDGEGKRDHEISYLSHLNDSKESTYYARNVRPEAVSADLGHDMTEDEIDVNINNLVYDHLFCRDCEKLFGVLETEYAKLYAEGKQISPRIAYLFWLSVFWRMSVGYMAIGLDIHDELEIRKILQDNLSSREVMEKSDSNLGNYGYIVFHASGIIKGDSGIFGTRTQHCPYIIILNDLIVALVRDNQKSHRIGHKTINSDYVNSWADDDIYVEEINLETFARFKRFVIDESYFSGYGKNREKLERELYEQCRHDGSAEAFDEALDMIKACRLIDMQDGLPPRLARNAQRFYTAALKKRAAQRLGRDYNYIKDRSLFLFQFDVDNYRNDLIHFSRNGKTILSYPMAKEIVPRKYWQDEVGYTDDIDYDEILDYGISHGYTLEDVLDRNGCLKSGGE